MFETLWKLLRDWPSGTVIGILLIALALFLIYMIVWGVCTAIDSWFRPTEIGTAVVTSKDHRPAWTQFIPITVGRVTSMTPIFHPESWYVCVELTHLSESGIIDITRKYYHEVTVGDKVTVKYVTGRLSKGVYIKGLT